MKYKITTFVALGILALAISLVSASGVATPYWNSNPLKLTPGQSTTVTLTLQNMVGNENVTLNASISSDSNIASISGPTQYFVPVGDSNVPVNVSVQLPSDAKVGQTYNINLLFNQISSGQGGMLHVASAFSTTIPVEVVGVAETSGSSTGIVIAIIAVILLASFIAIRKRRK